MKKIVITVLLSAFGICTYAQDVEKCGILGAIKKMEQNDPAFKKRVDETKLRNFKLAGAQSVTGGSVYFIPVVFHILHQNGNENISNMQVEDAVRILNIDFRKLNADTTQIVPEFKPLAADIEIEFRLATIDPDGNCTNGIIRHNTPATNFDGSYAYTGVGPGLWDPQKYLNFYICRSLDFPGAAAYTYIPGWLGAGNPADAVVSQHTYVGSIGTSSPYTSRVLTHEVGHWLGLDHVWGGTNSPGVACGDDGVSDTPITKGWGSCQLTGNQICTPGVTENVQNYMEYSYCDNMFTYGQKNLMRNVIATGANAGRDILVSSANLLATGVTNPIYCAPVADFTTVSNKFSFCTNQLFQLRDNTQNTHPTSWSWNCPGATPATSTDSMPFISYVSPGIYPISYTATNVAGTSNITKTDYIQIFSATAAHTSPVVEGFESNVIPGTEWITAVGADANTWNETNSASATGSMCAMVDNYTNDPSDVEVLYSLGYDLSAIASSGTGVSCTFKLAYQKRNSSSNDKLQVFTSSNCGQTWQQRYSKVSSNLATVAGDNANAFFPLNAGDWRTESVSISAIANQTNVMFKFVLTTDANGNGNNIFIDDININNTPVALQELDKVAVENVQVFPNPTSGKTNLILNLDRTSKVKMELFNVLGQKVESITNAEYQVGEHSFEVNATNLVKGVYFIYTEVNGSGSMKKLLVQ